MTFPDTDFLTRSEVLHMFFSGCFIIFGVVTEIETPFCINVIAKQYWL